MKSKFLIYGIIFLAIFSTVNLVSAKTFLLPNPKASPAAKKSMGGVPVSFSVEGTTIAANLYLPSGFRSNKKYPAIIVEAPQGGVKEQTAGIYAKKMAKLGYVTIAFDHRTYGQSGGQPRQYENPQHKSEDIKGAISYISSLPYVNKDKIGLIGICSGAGYGMLAATNDFRVKSYATVSGVFDWRKGETGLDDVSIPTKKQKARFRKKMMISAQARQRYFETGIMEYTKLVPDVTPKTNNLWREAYDYYRTKRGFINGWENKRAAISYEARFVNTSLFAHQLEDLGTPFLAIAGSKAVTLPLSVIAIKRAMGNKELFIVKGATHIDLYDKTKYVNIAVKKLNKYFKKTLHIK